ncbi:hypothetical protein C9439_01865 [archaeon SCG-AAA382B04]|nr:hypothetical protein C9439_01865 [archaeon SCG-AAA382B04]
MLVRGLSVGLLIVSHGGNDSKSNEIARIHADRLIGGYDLGIDEVEVASVFDKDISQKVISMSSNKVFVLPFLTAPGKHYNEDIPRELEKIEGKDVRLLETFGDRPQVTDALAEILEESKQE